MTPARLDAILDGREPPTDDEARDMLALAGALREAAPGAGTELRARVRALPERQPGRLRRLRDSGWRGRMLIAAPALSAAVAVVIAVGMIGHSSGDPSTVAENHATSRAQTLGKTAPTTSTTPSLSAVPPSVEGAATDAGVPATPITLRIAPATLATRIVDIRGLVTAAGGTVELADQRAQPPSSVVSITLPAGRSADVLDAIAALGTGPRSEAWSPYLLSPSQTGAAADALGGLTTVRVLLTEAP